MIPTIQYVPGRALSLYTNTPSTFNELYALGLPISQVAAPGALVRAHIARLTAGRGMLELLDAVEAG